MSWLIVDIIGVPCWVAGAEDHCRRCWRGSRGRPSAALEASSAPAQPLNCAFPELGPAAGSCAGFPGGRTPLAETLASVSTTQGAGLEEEDRAEGTATGSAVGVTGGVIRPGSPQDGLLQSSDVVTDTPLLSKREGIDARSLSQPSAVVYGEG